MKSRFLILLAAAMLTLLAGCRGAASPNQPSTVEPHEPETAATPVFQAGTWLAKSGETGTYYFFDSDGKSGRTAFQETGTGVWFTYTVQDGRGTFSMGSADDISICTVEQTASESITLKWEDGREEVLTYVSEEGSNEFQFYSNDTLCTLAMGHYSRVSGNGIKRLSAAAVTNEDGSVTVQVYENLEDHNSTAAWYTVDRRTGKGTDANTGEVVDLSTSEEDALSDHNKDVNERS